MKLGLLSLLPAALLVAQAQAVETSASAELAHALERDLGMAKAEMPRYINAEQHAFRVESQAKTFLGDSYAGSWFERNDDGSYTHFVATTDASDALANMGAKVQVVQFSLKQLEATQAAMDARLDDLYSAEPLVGLGSTTQSFADHESESGSMYLGSAIHSMYVDVKTNSVVVRVDANAMAAGIDFVASTEAEIGAVTIEPSEGKPTLFADIWGGREYRSGGGSCSVGFPVRRGSQNGFVTAGHCGGVGTSVSVGGQRVGSVQGSSFPGDDYAWASARSTDRLFGAVDRYNGGTVLDYNVRGSRVASIGAVVCRSGRTTGWRCGRIQQRNVTVNYGNGPTRGLTESTACAGRGDSGGAWVAASNQAQGVTSGGNINGSSGNNCGGGTVRTYFQPLNEILNRYGLSLVTR